MGSTKIQIGVVRSVLVALGFLAFTACSGNPNAQKLKYLRSGEEYAKSRKYQEAVIEFRNAIQIDANYAQAHLELARTFLSLNDRPQAVRELRQALSIDPKSSEVKLELATVLIGGRVYAESESLLREVAAAEPKNANVHAVLAARYGATHDLDKAIGELHLAIGLDPGHAEYQRVLGAVYLAAGDSARSESAFKDGITAEPKSSAAHIALGEFYFSQRKTAEAAAQMRSASELDPKAVPPRVFLGRIYALEGRLQDAEGVYKDLKLVAADSPEAYFGLALFYDSIGERKKALAEYRSLRSQRPKDSAIDAMLVESLIDNNEFAEAKAINAEILRKNQDDARARLSSGRILLHEGRPQEAVTQIERAVTAEPKAARNYYFLGLAQKAAGLPGLAKSAFSHALELNPSMTDAASALAALDARQGDLAAASKMAAKALASNPSLSMPHVSNAQVAIAQGDARKAEAQIEEALERDPTSLPSLATLVKIYSLEGKSKMAVQRLLKLVEQNSKNAGLRFLLAAAYFDAKDLERSEASLKEAIALDPRVPEAYTLLGNIDYAKGAVEKAHADFRRAIEASPRKLSNYLALAGFYQKEGNWEEAKRLCEKAHAIDPDSPAVAAQLVFLYLEHGGDFNTAVTLAQLVKQKIPDSPSSDDLLGWAYYKAGLPVLALTNLKKSVEKVPSNPIFQYHLGMAYLATRELQPAQHSLERALASHPDPIYAANAASALEKISRERR